MVRCGIAHLEVGMCRNFDQLVPLSVKHPLLDVIVKPYIPLSSSLPLLTDRVKPNLSEIVHNVPTSEDHHTFLSERSEFLSDFE